ncbi:Putative inner membrane protein [Salmonella enterica subsp. arizonae]|uniref:Inner membrane protein n=1 Tax=Salmonella enterica subsp. arizonae TaxID=59203 RepID=A0A379SF24_SALER|nr:Putative inner membrane protein [Salmonella enterica subsp. arizonae]
MADFTLSKSLFSGKHRETSSAPGNIAYAVFVLFCFWAGAQLLNLLVHAPGIYEHLMQVQDTGRPRVEIGLGVGTIFGLVPFLTGCLIFAVIAAFLRWASPSPVNLSALAKISQRKIYRPIHRARRSFNSLSKPGGRQLARDLGLSS